MKERKSRSKRREIIRCVKQIAQDGEAILKSLDRLDRVSELATSIERQARHIRKITKGGKKQQ